MNPAGRLYHRICAATLGGAILIVFHIVSFASQTPVEPVAGTLAAFDKAIACAAERGLRAPGGDTLATHRHASHSTQQQLVIQSLHEQGERRGERICTRRWETIETAGWRDITGFRVSGQTVVIACRETLYCVQRQRIARGSDCEDPARNGETAEGAIEIAACSPQNAREIAKALLALGIPETK